MGEISIKKYVSNSRMSKEEIISFQILLHCHTKGIVFSEEGRKIVNDTELRCLTLLGLWGVSELLDVCKKMKSMGLFKSTQSARNKIDLFEEKELVVKQASTGGTKKVFLHPSMQIQNEGNIMVDVKGLYIDN
jgi:hypothetical protein